MNKTENAIFTPTLPVQHIVIEYYINKLCNIMQWSAMMSHAGLHNSEQCSAMLDNARQCSAMLKKSQKCSNLQTKLSKCSNLQTKLSDILSNAQLGSALLEKGK